MQCKITNYWCFGVSATTCAGIVLFSGLYSKVYIDRLTSFCAFHLDSFSKRYNKHLINLVFLVCTVSYSASFLPLQCVAWVQGNWSGKSVVLNLQYSPWSLLVRALSTATATATAATATTALLSLQLQPLVQPSLRPILFPSLWHLLLLLLWHSLC